jgi:hypothetical protein
MVSPVSISPNVLHGSWTDGQNPWTGARRGIFDPTRPRSTVGSEDRQIPNVNQRIALVVSGVLALAVFGAVVEGRLRMARLPIGVATTRQR